MNATMHNVTVVATIPAGRDLLSHECEQRITKDGRLDPKRNVMVLYKATDGKAVVGIINKKPEDFIKKYWVGKELANPDCEVTFVGWIFTIHGKMKDLCEWSQSFP